MRMFLNSNIHHFHVWMFKTKKPLLRCADHKKAQPNRAWNIFNFRGSLGNIPFFSILFYPGMYNILLITTMYITFAC
jgi:hypothetical protein